MLKQEGSPEYTFGVKNIQKSELRPLHKFEQVLLVVNESPEFLKQSNLSVQDDTDPSNLFHTSSVHTFHEEYAMGPWVPPYTYTYTAYPCDKCVQWQLMQAACKEPSHIVTYTYKVSFLKVSYIIFDLDSVCSERKIHALSASK